MEIRFLPPPVNRSIRKVSGSTIDVRLYTISPHADWFYVAHLPSCEVLTESLAETARKALRARGWLRDMEAQVRAIGGDVAGLRYENPLHLYNVRFRPAEAEIYDPIVKVGATDAVRDCVDTR